ncbi:MAG: endonuclease/exonuclease/phosphatase family protein [Arcicella sp.]|nr:endonuclease/exonuclease/phosphatase family protein [Arcicella sp.]
MFPSIHQYKKIVKNILLELFLIVCCGIRLSYRFFRCFPKAYSCLIYLFVSLSFCCYPIFKNWIAGFIMMSLPFALLLGLLASLFLLYKKQKVIATVGIVWILCSFPILKRFVGVGNNANTPTSANSLHVLSFNSESFSKVENSNLSDLKADIACFQEYSPNNQVEKQYNNKVVRLTKFSGGREVGLALLTNYPIIKHYSKIWTREKAPNINGFIYADIVYGRDTIRVVNTHLWSMGIRINKVFDAFKQGEIKTFFFEISDTIHRLKNGFDARNNQVIEVESYVVGSRYPVIICGDFNEIPFSYTYGKLSLNFSNAFEEAGQGLGFTLNRHPYCVRIDQQFFSSDWQAQSCKVVPTVQFSDHFPVVAQYVLKRSPAIPATMIAQK